MKDIIEKYDLKTFLAFFPEFKPILEKEGTPYNVMFDMYLSLAKSTYSYGKYYENTIQIYGLYIAHNLQLAINRSKNINNNTNLNSSNATVSRKDNQGGKEEHFRGTIDDFYNSFASTPYGTQLYSLVKAQSKLDMMGVY